MKIQKFFDGYRATVKINGKEFFADLRTPGGMNVPELMIFRSKNGRISKYDRGNPAYTAYPETISKDTLKKHIFLFAMSKP